MSELSVDSLRAKVRSRDAEIQRLTWELSDSQEALQKLRSEHDEALHMVSKYEKLKVEKNEIQQKHETLSKSYELLERSDTSKIMGENMKLRQELLTLQAELAEARKLAPTPGQSRSATVGSLHEFMKDTVRNHLNEKAKHTDEPGAGGPSNDAALLAKDRQIEMLRNQLTEQRQRVKTLEAQLQARGVKTIDVTPASVATLIPAEEASTLRSETDRLRKQLEAAIVERDDAKNQLSLSEGELSSQRKRNDEAHSDVMRRLQEKEDALSETNRLLEKANLRAAAAEKEATSAVERAKSSASSAAKAAAALDSLDMEDSGGSKLSLTKRLCSLEADLDKALAQNSSLSIDLKDATESLSKKEMELEELKRSAEKSSSDVGKKLIENLQKRVDGLERTTKSQASLIEEKDAQIKRLMRRSSVSSAGMLSPTLVSQADVADGTPDTPTSETSGDRDRRDSATIDDLLVDDSVAEDDLPELPDLPDVEAPRRFRLPSTATSPILELGMKKKEKSGLKNSMRGLRSFVGGKQSNSATPKVSISQLRHEGCCRGVLGEHATVGETVLVVVGDVPGECELTWLRAADGMNFRPIPHANSVTYRVGADDTECALKVQVTPIHADGSSGKMLVAETPSLSLDVDMKQRVLELLKSEEPTFDVTFSGGGFAQATGKLLISQQKLKFRVEKKGNEKSIVKIPKGAGTQVVLDDRDPCLFSLIDAVECMTVRTPSALDRDLVVLTLRAFLGQLKGCK